MSQEAPIAHACRSQHSPPGAVAHTSPLPTCVRARAPPVSKIYALVMLLWEEVPARLKGDDELLWRLFYRRCGAIKREFSYVSVCELAGSRLNLTCLCCPSSCANSSSCTAVPRLFCMLPAQRGDTHCRC